MFINIHKNKANMKKLIMLLLVGIFICSAIHAQSPYLDSSREAKDAAKAWLKAWDKGDISAMVKLSADSTDTATLRILIRIHNAEKPKILWGTATWWLVERYTAHEYKIDSTTMLFTEEVETTINGFMVTASFDSPRKENLPLFMQLDKKGKWVVNIEHSNLDIDEEPKK